MRLRTVGLVGLLLAAIAVLIGLGVWQLQRNEWRQNQIAERHARHDAGPLEVSRLQAMPLDELDFHRARARGAWDYDHAMILANRIRFHVRGEDIVVPLLIEPDGPALLVNRGWYPEGERDRVLAELRADAHAEIEGLVRYDPTRTARQTPAGTWSTLSTASMAAALPYPVLPWYVIEGEMIDPDAPPPADLPAQGYLPYQSHVPHMQYAITWFGLAATLVGVAAVRLVIVPRRDRARAARERAEAAETPGAAPR
jgi:surfeit locus 1 family protein